MADIKGDEGSKIKASRSSMSIVILGDEGVGKSSLISTFVSRHFSDIVPPIMTRVRLPPDPTVEGSAITTIMDSQCGDAALLSVVNAATGTIGGDTLSLSSGSLTDLGRSISSATSSSILLKVANNVNPRKGDIRDAVSFARGVNHVDSIVLVYDLDRIETFYRLENHWLPLIERCYNGEVPVIIAGNKMDLFRQSHSFSPGEEVEKSLIRTHRQTVALLQRFKFVRECIKCSAKNLLNVDEVFIKAQQAVLYPITPSLYNLEEGRIADDCKRAFTRIFRMYDSDNDGLLSNSELNNFQSFAFNVPIAERDFAGWKKVVAKNNSMSGSPNDEDSSVLRDGKFTVAGFLTIFDVFISQNRLEVPWKILRKFGYDDKLNLRIPSCFSSRKRSSTNTVDLDDDLRIISISARNFLTAIFHQFDSNKDGILSNDDIMKVFSVIPEPSLPPWHPFRIRILDGSASVPTEDQRSEETVGSSLLSTTMSPPLTASDITLDTAESLPCIETNINNSINFVQALSYLDWMGHFYLMSVIYPLQTRAELYRLGFVEDTSSIGLTGQSDCLKGTWKSEQCFKSIKNYSSLILPTKVFRIFVIGKKGSGKTALINFLRLHNTAKTFGVCEGLSLENHIFSLLSKSVTKTETSYTYISVKPEVTAADEKEKDANCINELVSFFILTEVPDMANFENLTRLLSESGPKSCDLVLLTFCCSDQESLVYINQFEKEVLNDTMPRILIGIKGQNSINQDIYDSKEFRIKNLAYTHCKTFDLEPPIFVSLTTGNHDQRIKTLEYLGNCLSTQNLRITPHAEKKRREASKRKKMLWFGGFISVSCVISLGVSVYFQFKKEHQKDGRMFWLYNLLPLTKKRLTIK